MTQILKLGLGFVWQATLQSSCIAAFLYQRLPNPEHRSQLPCLAQAESRNMDVRSSPELNSGDLPSQAQHTDGRNQTGKDLPLKTTSQGCVDPPTNPELRMKDRCLYFCIIKVQSIKLKRQQCYRRTEGLNICLVNRKEIIGLFCSRVPCCNPQKDLSSPVTLATAITQWSRRPWVKRTTVGSCVSYERHSLRNHLVNSSMI